MHRLRYLFKNSRFNLNYFHNRYYAKDVRFGRNVKALMLEGVDILADAVAVTMGPKGRTVIIEQNFGPPTVTKDGVTVAKSIELSNNFQNMGAKIVQDVAKKTNNEAGDGTTTATVLARAIAKDGFQRITVGCNPIEIRKGITLAVQAVKEKLEKMSRPISTEQEIEHIATISANGDTSIGKVITKAITLAGKDGVVTIKTGRRFNDEIEIVEGMQFDRGFLSPYFINSHKGPKVEYKDAYVLFCQKKIFTLAELVPALEICMSEKKPLAIIAENIEEEPLSALIVNKVKIGLPVVAVKAPGFGNFRKKCIEDMAIACGGALFEDDTNLIRLEDCMKDSLGRVGEIVIDKHTTLLIQGAGLKEEIDQRIQEIHNELKETTFELDKRRLMERISRLKSRVAVLKIGGYSEVEANEKKDRINDALNATRAAIDEGILPGGGTALLRCIPVLNNLTPANSDQGVGIDIVRNALRIPCMTIANNAGYDGPIIISRLESMSDEIGYDVLNNDFVNMIEKGIIDPTKVVKRALIDASGVASLLTTAEAVICDLVAKVQPIPKINKYNRHVTEADL